MPGTPPILLCASKGYLDVVCTLIGGGVDVNVSTNDGYSPLFAASREEKHDVVIELLAAGKKFLRYLPSSPFNLIRVDLFLCIY